MEWVSLCPGTFTMGSDESDAMSQPDERVDPPRVVSLGRFEMTKTEITNAQYKLHDPRHKPEDSLPVTDVTWAQARAFCQGYGGGDLPTEAQWEYAARGGSQTLWSFGDDEKVLGEYAWFGESPLGTAHPVGQKRPNPLGLHDMYGNVWEWVRDWYGDYPSGFFVDPGGPSSGGRRVLRGGSFDDTPERLRSARRFDFDPEVRARPFGFRCVRVPPQL
jgi:formylglycine-generating enzyme required for sulfatase activity